MQPNYEVQQKRENGLRPEPSSLMEKSWEAVFDAFIINLDVKQNTKKQYRKSLSIFYKWCAAQGIQLNTISRADVLKYKQQLLAEEKRLSTQTVAVYLVALRRFFEWLEAEKIYPNIAKGVKSPRIKKEFVKQHLTTEECIEILNKLYDDVEGKIRKKTYANQEENGLRDYALVNLLLRTGLRTIELARLDVEDVTFKRRKRVIIVQGKGRDSKDDYVPLSEKAYQPLAAYLGTRPRALPDEPLFVCAGYGSHGRRMSTRRIQAICKEALRGIGLNDHEFSAHSFRHTCAVTLIQAGASAYDVQKFLRHSSIDTTEIYLKSIEEDLRLGKSPENMLDHAF